MNGAVIIEIIVNQNINEVEVFVPRLLAGGPSGLLTLSFEDELYTDASYTDALYTDASYMDASYTEAL